MFATSASVVRISSMLPRADCVSALPCRTRRLTMRASPSTSSARAISKGSTVMTAATATMIGETVRAEPPRTRGPGRADRSQRGQPFRRRAAFRSLSVSRSRRSAIVARSCSRSRPRTRRAIGAVPQRCFGCIGSFQRLFRPGSRREHPMELARVDSERAARLRSAESLPLAMAREIVALPTPAALAAVPRVYCMIRIVP